MLTLKSFKTAANYKLPNKIIKARTLAIYNPVQYELHNSKSAFQHQLKVNENTSSSASSAPSSNTANSNSSSNTSSSSSSDSSIHHPVISSDGEVETVGPSIRF